MTCRIVLDTNVFISALINPEGPPGIIIREILEDNDLLLLLSQPIIDELLRTLHYPKLRKYLSLSEEQIKLWLDSLIMLAHIIIPRFTYGRLVPDDPKDDCYLIAAIEGKAQYVISGDRHLLNLHPFQGISILKPADFVQRC